MDLQPDPSHWEDPRAPIKPLCWRGVQELGYDEYYKRVRDGWDAGRAFLFEKSELCPSADTIMQVHKYMFHRVYPFAGNRRTENDPSVFFGANGNEFIGAFPSRIEPELNKFFGHAAPLINAAATREHAAQAIAFYHAKLKRIHPFRDGNTRVALLINDYQSEKLLGRGIPEFLRNDYGRCHNSSLETGDLRLLASIIPSWELPPELAQSPEPLDLERGFTVDVRLNTGTVIELRAPDTDVAYDILRADLSRGNEHLRKEPPGEGVLFDIPDRYGSGRTTEVKGQIKEHLEIAADQEHTRERGTDRRRERKK